MDMNLPLPGDIFEDAGAVIASCWLNDTPEDGEITFVLLTLTKTPGKYYRVVYVAGNQIRWFLEFENIIPAVEHYSEEIGGF